MKNLIKITSLTIFTLFLMVGASMAQVDSKADKSDKKCGGGCCSAKETSSKMDKKSMHHDKMTAVKLMDTNKDGKIFQCTMCSNQISDKIGKCGKCGMNLKEVSVKDVEEKLGKTKHKMMDHAKMDHSKMNHSKMDHNSVTEDVDIDFTSIDKNENGKVFQCPMVCDDELSDEAADCAVCGMHMKEVLIKDVKTN